MWRDAEEELGGVAEEGVVAVVEVGAEPGGKAAGEVVVDRARCAREAGGEALGEVDLENVAGGDVVDGAADGGFVGGLGEV